MSMASFIAIVLIMAAAGYLTSIPCRVAESRRHRAGWYAPFVGVIGAAILAVLVIYQGDLFRPSVWDEGKVGMTLLVPLTFCIVCAIGVIPSFLVFWMYRKKYEDQHPTA